MKKDGKSTVESTAAQVFYSLHLSLKEQLPKDRGQSTATAVRFLPSVMSRQRRKTPASRKAMNYRIPE